MESPVAVIFNGDVVTLYGIIVFTDVLIGGSGNEVVDSITLDDLIKDYEKLNTDKEYMYYI